MNKQKLFWGFFLTSMMTTLAAVIAVAWYFFRVMDERTVDNARSQLTVHAELAGQMISGDVFNSKLEVVRATCKEAAGKTGSRLTVVGASGEVVADTEHDPAAMENHGSRPEVAEALRGRVGISTRHSDTLKVRMMYVAIPVKERDMVVGAVRAAVAVPMLDSVAEVLHFRVRMVVAGILLLAAVVSYVAARRVSRPVELLKVTAERFGRGDFRERAPTSRWSELTDLAVALNTMAERLKDRIDEVIQQKNELEVVLSGMVEGVVAVDKLGMLMSMNRAAIELFDLDERRDRGRNVCEVIHDPDIQDVIGRVLEGGDVVEIEVEYAAEQGKWIKVKCAPLEDYAGRRGAVVVAEDYTQRRRIDRMRRDFVANASHELQTPIAAIKGALETLQGGALNDPEAARQFTDMAVRQAERLENLAGDLLKLSSVEHDMEARRIVMDVVPLDEVLRAAMESCRPAASAKMIEIKVDCQQGLDVRANTRLLEQAVINLLDNAIKYSGQGKSVLVKAKVVDEGVEILVKDQGCGIDAQHLDRIFERFYRVDKGRSREAGGTGLGLSIVRHITLAHGGTVSVDSVVGEGSVFTMRFPALQNRGA